MEGGGLGIKNVPFTPLSNVCFMSDHNEKKKIKIDVDVRRDEKSTKTRDHSG